MGQKTSCPAAAAVTTSSSSSEGGYKMQYGQGVFPSEMSTVDIALIAAEHRFEESRIRRAYAEQTQREVETTGDKTIEQVREAQADTFEEIVFDEGAAREYLDENSGAESMERRSELAKALFDATSAMEMFAAPVEAASGAVVLFPGVDSGFLTLLRIHGAIRRYKRGEAGNVCIALIYLQAKTERADFASASVAICSAIPREFGVALFTLGVRIADFDAYELASAIDFHAFDPRTLLGMALMTYNHASDPDGGFLWRSEVGGTMAQTKGLFGYKPKVFLDEIYKVLHNENTVIWKFTHDKGFFRISYYIGKLSPVMYTWVSVKAKLWKGSYISLGRPAESVENKRGNATHVSTDTLMTILGYNGYAITYIEKLGVYCISVDVRPVNGKHIDDKFDTDKGYSDEKKLIVMTSAAFMQHRDRAIQLNAPPEMM